MILMAPACFDMMRTKQGLRLSLAMLALVVGGALALCCADAPLEGVGSACSSDDRCSSGFCDLGRCADPTSSIVTFANECRNPGPALNSGPIGYSGRENGKFGHCAGFLCIDDRCRSCTSAKECYEALGYPSCYGSGEWPGKRCGSNPPADAEVYEPVPVAPQEGNSVEAVEPEAGMPTHLVLQVSNPVPDVARAHLAVVWWHQRSGEPDEYLRIAYDVPIDASFTELSIPFSGVALPAEENLICWRDCRDRSLCPCSAPEQFALGSVLVAIDQDGDGALSFDEIRREQIGGTSALIGWSPATVEAYDATLTSIHQGFAVYTSQGAALLDAVTSNDAPAAALAFCPPGDQECAFAVEHVYCLAPACSTGTRWGLNRFGL
jgi:hypothetical protein